MKLDDSFAISLEEMYPRASVAEYKGLYRIDELIQALQALQKLNVEAIQFAFEGINQENIRIHTSKKTQRVLDGKHVASIEND